jgi:hypothetical protein
MTGQGAHGGWNIAETLRSNLMDLCNIRDSKGWRLN